MEQLALFKKRGGARPDAGRPPLGHHAKPPHRSRPHVTIHTPVHITLRLARGPSATLRNRHIYRALHFAVARALHRDDFKVIHISIQHDHVHLVVEATDRDALGRGVRGFAISAARQINATRGTRGTVFPSRYHAEVITSPRHARNTLAYVLNNWRKHGEHRRPFARRWRIDPYSSAACFTGWAEDQSSPTLWPVPPTYDRFTVSRPRSWLLRIGWQLHGGPMSTACDPGSRRRPRSR